VSVGAITNAQHGAAERALLAMHFNATTPENEMKWGVVAPTVGAYDFAAADAIAAFAVAAGLRLRMHTLLWGRLQLPSDLATEVAAASDPAARLRELIDAHLRTMTARYGDRAAVWDVVNEPLAVASGDYDANLFYETLGPGYITEAFRRMRALAPIAKLFLNEFLLGVPSAKADALVALVRDLRAADVPVDGVGIQAHFFPALPLPDPAALETLLRALGDTGVEVELTEVDVSIWHFRDDPDPFARQGEYYGAVSAACMAVPACRGITTWGLTDDETWLDTFPPFDAFAPNAPLLFDAAFQAKPAYFAVRDAVAARAVPFAEQARALRRAYREARRSRALAHPGGRSAIRDGARALRRAHRALRREDFARGCVALAAAGEVLAAAAGSAQPTTVAAVAALRADLDC